MTHVDIDKTAVQMPLHRLVRTDPRPPIRDLDSLPPPDRSLADYEKYSRYIGLALVKNSISIQTTRGCPYRCAFCHKLWPKTHVCRSSDHIFAEVKSYYDIGIRRFSIVDDIFNLDRKNSRRFFEKIRANRMDVQFMFSSGVRGDILTEDYIDLMVEAGTVNMALALETASPRLQKLIGKELDIEKLRKNIEYICSRHPQIILDLFTMIGFPTETEEEAKMTLDFIKGIRWLHFPIISLLKIYPNTDMEKIALQHGISREKILESRGQAFHQSTETLPFPKNFVAKFQADFLNHYFLSKERLLHVLPYQQRILDEDEIVQKYDSYLSVDIKNFRDLLEFAGLAPEELGKIDFFKESTVRVDNLNERFRQLFPCREPAADALKILLLDLSQFFSGQVDMLYDVVEAPLGLMYILTYLNRELGPRIEGKIVKSRIDFDSYEELKEFMDSYRPDLIGVRTLTYYAEFFHQVIARIRRWGFDGPIITGGPYATSDYEEILQDTNVDLVVLGEGEETASQLIRFIMENGGKLPDEEKLRKIPGIVFRSVDTVKTSALFATSSPGPDLAESRVQSLEEWDL